MRLAEALGEELDAQEPGRWRCERGVIVAKRDELFAFVRVDGIAIRIFLQSRGASIRRRLRRRATLSRQ